ncbi:hypothetical protein D1872_323220 [compost metagenome]
MEDANQGLHGADYAVYLIHSMLPSAKLTQGTFEDMDVILAEHFARAARNNGVKQIVYLSVSFPSIQVRMNYPDIYAAVWRLSVY